MWSDGNISLFFNHICTLHKLSQISILVHIPSLDVTVIEILQVNELSTIM